MVTADFKKKRITVVLTTHGHGGGLFSEKIWKSVLTFMRMITHQLERHLDFVISVDTVQSNGSSPEFVTGSAIIPM